ncbi:hypothetical protein [Nocardia mangyaensis]|uniref:hypothetical protein n=1 Tax=Nocardia mangyaensis TaxID=2213200 RepID=UPI0026754965|nr:hypothetical protein [Nocardia mangyaensis]MDO3650459.1 hypothetical protein [Nocardia mangyaensis]
MHPDPQPGPDTGPIVHVTQDPRFATQPDGRVRAYYPGEDWHVTGADRNDAIAALITESEQRMRDPEYLAQHWEMTQRHRDGREHTPGLNVREIDQTEYEIRTAMLGEQLRSSTDPNL